jgi:phage shock protein PspC (stress-responsive transcriptional regulator)|tara:strand:+ start:568 stop:783 length:216 start_codon:yes stop_codon:yes gene_type:complete
MKKLHRNPQEGKIAGVCAGIGDYFEIDPVIIRLIFLMALFVGGGLLVYIIAWIIVPKQVFEHIYQQHTSSA